MMKGSFSFGRYMRIHLDEFSSRCWKPSGLFVGTGRFILKIEIDGTIWTGLQILPGANRVSIDRTGGEMDNVVHCQ